MSEREREGGGEGDREREVEIVNVVMFSLTLEKNIALFGSPLSFGSWTS